MPVYPYENQWAWQVLGLDGVALADVIPQKATITRNLNAASGVTLEVLASAPGATEIGTTGVLLFGWRYGAYLDPAAVTRGERFCGKVTSVTATASTDGQEMLSVVAQDPVHTLQNRVSQFTWVVDGTSSGTIYRDGVPYVINAGSAAGVEPHLVYAAILQSENEDRFPTGLQIDPLVTDSGPERWRLYEVGKGLGDILQQLCEIDDGAWYRVDPFIDTVAGIYYWGILRLFWPDPGEVKDLWLGWGEGTAGNLSSVTVDVVPPTNFALALGANSSRKVAFDLGSVATYGLYDTVVSRTDITLDTALTQAATDAVIEEQVHTYDVTPSSFMESCPVPWDDFDVGDALKVQLRGATAPMIFEGNLLVSSFTVEVDESGVERWTQAKLETARGGLS